MDPKADIIVDDQTFIDWTRRERLPVTEDLILNETPTTFEDPFVSELGQIAGIKITHPGHSET